MVTRSRSTPRSVTAAVEGVDQPVPSLARLAAPGVEDEGPADPVPGPEARRVVRRRDVDAGAGHRMVFGHGAETVGELVLGLGEEPHRRRGGQGVANDVDARVALVVETRHDDGALGHGSDARQRGPEQVRREHHGVVARAVGHEVVEQLRAAEVEPEPPDLLVGRGDAPGLDQVLGPVRHPRVIAHGREPPHQHPVLLGGALGQDVVPGEVVHRAGGEDLDRPTPGRRTPWPPRATPPRSPHHLGAEAGGDERDPPRTGLRASTVPHGSAQAGGADVGPQVESHAPGGPARVHHLERVLLVPPVVDEPPLRLRTPMLTP